MKKEDLSFKITIKGKMHSEFRGLPRLERALKILGPVSRPCVVRSRLAFAWVLELQKLPIGTTEARRDEIEAEAKRLGITTVSSALEWLRFLVSEERADWLRSGRPLTLEEVLLRYHGRVARGYHCGLLRGTSGEHTARRDSETP